MMLLELLNEVVDIDTDIFLSSTGCTVRSLIIS